MTGKDHARGCRSALLGAFGQIPYFAFLLVLLAGMVQAQTTVNIHGIQTDLPNSPYLGDSVTTEGIVTAVLADGFYIENSSSTSNCTGSATLNCWDNSVATAEGIYVYTGATLPATAVVGNLVMVTGAVYTGEAATYTVTVTPGSGSRWMWR